MSAAHGESEHEHDDDGHDDHFDGEPATELPPDEPRTPGWVPLLGLGLFALGATYLLVTTEPGDDSKTEGSSAASATASAPAGPPLEGVRMEPPAGGAAPPAARPKAPDITPEQAEALRKRVEEARKRREMARDAKTPPPPAE
jgi:hypothetical protein